MKLETFFEKFEFLAEAPNGVQKLRELILQLAVQGKLVPQDPSDESALGLLDKIQFSKGQLINDKNIRKSEVVSSIQKKFLPYELPNAWEWAYLEQISNVIHYGYTASANPNIKDVRLLRITDIQNNRVNWESVPGCEIDKNQLKNYQLNNGDLLVARTGGTIGKSYLVENLSVCAVFASYLIRVIPNFLLVPNYLKLFFESGFYWQQLYAKSMGTGQPNVNGTSLKSLIIPIPPSSEQHRIVSKVNQLMSLCDELEERQQKKRETRVLLNTVAINQLLTAREPDTFAKHWQRICNNFDLLYSAPENIGKLRQAILQLAVMGKLVPQDSSDEPAAVLLDKIRFEKELLVKDNKLTNLQKLLPLTSDECLYEIPQNWSWVRLQEILTFGPRNGYSPKPVDYPTNVKSLTLSATTSGNFKSNFFKYIDEKIELNSHLWLKEGDILIQRANTLEYVGISAIYKGLHYEYIYPDLIMKICVSELIETSYIYHVINNEYSRKFLRARATGTSSNMPKINQNTVNSLPIPLPPITEQKRIVAKVDQLMNICNELEVKLLQSQNDNEKLMDVVVRQLLVKG